MSWKDNNHSHRFVVLAVTEIADGYKLNFQLKCILEMSEMITLVALMAIYAHCAGIKYMIMFGFKFFHTCIENISNYSNQVFLTISTS